jgi:hypothetical protein
MDMHFCGFFQHRGINHDQNGKVSINTLAGPLNWVLKGEIFPFEKWEG